jgi:hypothetical protein
MKYETECHDVCVGVCPENVTLSERQLEGVHDLRLSCCLCIITQQETERKNERLQYLSNISRKAKIL